VPARRAFPYRTVLLLAAGLLLAGGLALQWRARIAQSERRPAAVLTVDKDQAPGAAEAKAGEASANADQPLVVEDPPKTAALAAVTPEAVPRPSSDDPKPAPTSARPHRVAAGRALTLIRATNVLPWAEVVVDGNSLGYTANTWKVAPGHHHLLLRNGKAGIEREFDLEFPSGGEVQLRGPLRSLQPELVR